MKRFQRLDAIAVPLAAADVDTDQIIPARFMQKPRSDDFARYLFHDLRQGPERFITDRPEYRGAGILVADRNFGCGSSREQAVYALHDHGFRVVIAPSFGDIFFVNCFQNGLLPVVLPEPEVATLLGELTTHPGRHLVVDLATQTVTGFGGAMLGFAVDPFRKALLLDGIDEIDFTSRYARRIAEFETSHKVW